MAEADVAIQILVERMDRDAGVLELGAEDPAWIAELPAPVWRVLGKHMARVNLPVFPKASDLTRVLENLGSIANLDCIQLQFPGDQSFIHFHGWNDADGRPVVALVCGLAPPGWGAVVAPSRVAVLNHTGGECFVTGEAPGRHGEGLNA